MTRFTLKIILAGWAVVLGGFISLAPTAGLSVVLLLALSAFLMHLRWIANRTRPEAKEASDG